jgi:hypothetical protein
MACPVRIEFEGTVYHVTSRGSARQEAAISKIDRGMENGKPSERTKTLMNKRLPEGHTKTKDLTPFAHVRSLPGEQAMLKMSLAKRLAMYACVALGLVLIAQTAFNQDRGSAWNPCVTHDVSAQSKELKQYSSVFHVNREKIGLIPIKLSARMTIGFCRYRDDQWVTLTIHSNPTKVCILYKDHGKYVLTRETDIYVGPKTYEDCGTKQERMLMTYNYLNKTINIVYVGPNRALRSNRRLTTTDIDPLLKAWGYQIGEVH